MNAKDKKSQRTTDNGQRIFFESEKTEKVLRGLL